MSNLILIMGNSGTGKSSSIRTLNPEETFIINILDKPLPFKGGKSSYNKEYKNYFVSDDPQEILKILQVLDTNKKYSHIKTVIIDDFQYCMSVPFMRRARESGWNKFTEIGQDAFQIIYTASKCVRNDLDIFILSHTEVGADNMIKIKTIGKIIDNNVDLHGVFTFVFHSLVIDGRYVFLTNQLDKYIAKSPMGLFDDLYIDNDLYEIKQKIKQYGEIE